MTIRRRVAYSFAFKLRISIGQYRSSTAPFSYIFETSVTSTISLQSYVLAPRTRFPRRRRGFHATSRAPEFAETTPPDSML